MLNWWRQRKMRWAVREVNRRKIRKSEIGEQTILTTDIGTAERFEREYATRSAITVQELRGLGRVVRPCFCEWDECPGWQSVNEKDWEARARLC